MISTPAQCAVARVGGPRSVDADDLYALVEKYPQFLSGMTPYIQAQALVRRYAVLDGSGHKDWYTGGAQEMGELTRLADGSYQSVMTWSTQSLLRLPDALSLTPYTYDAYMSPVYEKAQSLTAPLK